MRTLNCGLTAGTCRDAAARHPRSRGPYRRCRGRGRPAPTGGADCHAARLIRRTTCRSRACGCCWPRLTRKCAQRAAEQTADVRMMRLRKPRQAPAPRWGKRYPPGESRSTHFNHGGHPRRMNPEGPLRVNHGGHPQADEPRRASEGEPRRAPKANEPRRATAGEPRRAPADRWTPKGIRG